MQTLATLIDTHGVDVDAHLDRADIVPVHTGLQFQGDVAVVPVEHFPRGTVATQPVSAGGVAVVRGENGGNTHLLLAAGQVTWADQSAGLRLGVLHVTHGATAYLAHPEHGYLGVGPGTYEVRRQREQADEIRMVAD